MQNYQKIEKLVLKYSNLIFIFTIIVLTIISIILNLPGIALGAAFGYFVSVIGYILSTKAIDFTMDNKTSLIMPLSYFLKMVFYGIAMFVATQTNWLNLWSLLGCMFIIKIATYYVQLGGKADGWH